MGGAVSAIAFPAPSKNWIRYFRQRPDRLYLRPDGGRADGPGEDIIAAIHIRTSSGQARRAILYSHGNAEDLGQILPYLDRLAQVCSADVVAFDYPGYCDSGGQPSEDGCYVAVKAAYAYLKDQVDPSKIVAFGRSIGSGPTVDLVSKCPEIRAMVLQSPIESGIRTVMPVGVARLLYGLDLFRNYEKVGKIKCPAFVMHGDNDQVVPFTCGKAVHSGLEHAEPLVTFPGRGHNDMPEDQCLMKVRDFLDTKVFKT
jgi:pimeloyl-ACP methyl ester carboxylesterase